LLKAGLGSLERSDSCRNCALPQHVLPPAEVETVLALPDVATPEGLRDRAMMEVLYSTGLRRVELLQLAVFSVSLEQGTVSVRQGKGRKDMVGPIGERALAWVRKYLDEARPRLVLGELGANASSRCPTALRSVPVDDRLSRV
jgi:integrase/recombinase XerD